MINKRLATATLVLAVLAFLGAVTLFGSAGAVRAQDLGTPLPGTVSEARYYQFYAPTMLSTDGTIYYTSAPLTVQGTDISDILAWHSADVFVTADVLGTATLTVTPQLSADQTNWADAEYTYISTISGTSSLTTLDQAIVLSADGTDYLRFPLAGQYLRFKIEATMVVSVVNAVTPTIGVVLRND